MSLRMMIDETQQYSHELFRHGHTALVDELPQLAVGEANAVVPRARTAEANFVGIVEWRNAESPFRASQLTGVIKAG
jgi:hypothetical protein